jgi:hypothetical protein
MKLACLLVLLSRSRPRWGGREKERKGGVLVYMSASFRSKSNESAIIRMKITNLWQVARLGEPFSGHETGIFSLIVWLSISTRYIVVINTSFSKNRIYKPTATTTRATCNRFLIRAALDKAVCLNRAQVVPGQNTRIMKIMKQTYLLVLTIERFQFDHF